VTSFEREIREQPQVVSALLRAQRARAEEIAAEVRRVRPRLALIAARGSSDNAARYAKYVLGARNRLVVGLAAPALHTIYRTPPDLAGALVIGISQSGESPDVVAVVDDAARQGALTVAITNEAASPLARAASLALAIGAGEERAVAASKTYTGQLAALAMLSAAIEGEDGPWRELERAPDAMTAALDAAASARAAAPRLVGAARIATLGRGFNFASAFEAALKLKELTRIAAEAASPADFLHGPIAMVDEGFPIVMVAPGGVQDADALHMAARLGERRALLAVVSDRADLLARAEIPLALPIALPEWLSPLAAIVPAQLLALSVAEALGLDPDRPRGLAKVTRTT